MSGRSRAVELRRIYDARRSSEVGRRVLVDRLWPRGVSRDEAALDEWLRDVAPSTELRRWYGHRVERFDEFVRRYRDELCQPPAADAFQQLTDMAVDDGVVLLTATRDVDHSAARVLYDALVC